MSFIHLLDEKVKKKKYIFCQLNFFLCALPSLQQNSTILLAYNPHTFTTTALVLFNTTGSLTAVSLLTLKVPSLGVFN